MLNVNVTKSGFEYDIRSLIKAFFHSEELIYNDILDWKEEEFYDRKITDDSNINIYIGIFDERIIVRCRYNQEEYESSLEVSKVKELEKDIFTDLESTEKKSETDSLESSDIVSGIEKTDNLESARTLSENIKLAYKNTIKKCIYNILTKITGNDMPWGTLTGIRPTKIAVDKLQSGYKDDDIVDYMKKTYLCSEEKAKTAILVANKELEILNKADYQNSYSLYIGIPFCPTICTYCSFSSFDMKAYKEYIDSYLEALFKEIDYAGAIMKYKLTTVYIGGGTPTTLTAKQLDMLISRIKSRFDFSNVIEFTVEAGRPDSIDYDKLKVLKEHNVTRISINPQSMHQKTLDIIGRKHTVNDVVSAYDLARKAGHNNINMDIILGLPGENIEDVRYTLKRLHELGPEGITVHTLAIKRAATLNVEKSKYQDMLPVHVSDMVEESFNFMRQREYIPYYLYRQKNMTDNLENIGYSKEGFEGIYNVLIMEEKQNILALGAGAVCKFISNSLHKLERVDNVKNVKVYIERIEDMIAKKDKFIHDKGAYYDGFC